MSKVVRVLRPADRSLFREVSFPKSKEKVTVLDVRKALWRAPGLYYMAFCTDKNADLHDGDEIVFGEDGQASLIAVLSAMHFSVPADAAPLVRAIKATLDRVLTPVSHPLRYEAMMDLMALLCSLPSASTARDMLSQQRVYAEPDEDTKDEARRIVRQHWPRFRRIAQTASLKLIFVHLETGRPRSSMLRPTSLSGYLETESGRCFPLTDDIDVGAANGRNRHSICAYTRNVFCHATTMAVDTQQDVDRIETICRAMESPHIYGLIRSFDMAISQRVIVLSHHGIDPTPMLFTNKMSVEHKIDLLHSLIEFLGKLVCVSLVVPTDYVANGTKSNFLLAQGARPGHYSWFMVDVKHAKLCDTRDEALRTVHSDGLREQFERTVSKARVGKAGSAELRQTFMDALPAPVEKQKRRISSSRGRETKRFRL